MRLTLDEALARGRRAKLNRKIEALKTAQDALPRPMSGASARKYFKLRSKIRALERRLTQQEFSVAS